MMRKLSFGFVFLVLISPNLLLGKKHTRTKKSQKPERPYKVISEPKMSPFHLIASPIVIPFGALYYDLSLYGEGRFFQKGSLLLGLHYAGKHCNDCLPLGKNQDYGLSLYYRHYLPRFVFDVPFLMAGVKILKETANDSVLHQKASSTQLEPEMIFGFRTKTHPFFGEFGGGAKYRTKEVKAGDYVGYKAGLRPMAYLTVGYSF